MFFYSNFEAERRGPGLHVNKQPDNAHTYCVIVSTLGTQHIQYFGGGPIRCLPCPRLISENAEIMVVHEHGRENISPEESSGHTVGVRMSPIQSAISVQRLDQNLETPETNA